MEKLLEIGTHALGRKSLLRVLSVVSCLQKRSFPPASALSRRTHKSC